MNIHRRDRRSLSDVVRGMIQKQPEEREKFELALAASALLADYLDDLELTTFSALDAEDFHT